jgi:hypothetical protein
MDGGGSSIAGDIDMGVRLPKAATGSNRLHKPFQPAPGRDFGGVEETDAKTRDFLARFLAVASGLAVSVTGAHGLVTGDYATVVAVWAVAGPLVGALVTYYFGLKRDDIG